MKNRYAHMEIPHGGFVGSHADLTNLADGASIRPRLSAPPSVFPPDGNIRAIAMYAL